MSGSSANYKYGFGESDILTSGRVVVNGQHEIHELEVRKDNLEKKDFRPLIEGNLEARHWRVLDGEICCTRKQYLLETGEWGEGYQKDGYVGSELATGFSVVNAFGDADRPWWIQKMELEYVGVADQGATYDETGMHDDPDITFQIRGHKSMRNVGPHTLHKGKKWLWQLQRNTQHARDIAKSVPRQSDRPQDRYTFYPEEFDPSIHHVNTGLMALILVNKEIPVAEALTYEQTEPIVAGIMSFDKNLRRLMALREIVDDLLTTDEVMGQSAEEAINDLSRKINTQDASKNSANKILSKYGLRSSNNAVHNAARRAGAK